MTKKNLQLTSRYKIWQTIAFAFVLVLLLRQLGNSLTGWIDQLCTGMGAAMVLPMTAFISWRINRKHE